MSLPEALLRQAKACDALGSPFNARVLRLIAVRLRPGLPVADRLLTWSGDIGPAGQSVPLRLAGSLHALVLSAAHPGLAACYPPNPVGSDADLWAAIEDALQTCAGRLNIWLDSPPQTNEVARSAALIAAAQDIAGTFGLPFVLSELGASAGLNLFWDKYALALPGGKRLGAKDPVLVLEPDWTGPSPAATSIDVAARRGVDLNPLDPRAAEDRLRLAAYIWPDQADRHARSAAALAVADPVVDRGTAADWLATRLSVQYPGHVHMIYHTVAWQYFPTDEQKRARDLIEEAGEAATKEAPLAWFGMEADGENPGAGMTLRLWPGDILRDLGRVDFHGRWVRWAG